MRRDTGFVSSHLRLVASKLGTNFLCVLRGQSRPSSETLSWLARHTCSIGAGLDSWFGGKLRAKGAGHLCDDSLCVVIVCCADDSAPEQVAQRIHKAQTLAEASLKPVALLLCRDLMWED